MLFTLSLLLLLTPLPSLQTTTNEKRNSTGSDTIKTDAVLTTSIPRTMATLAKQKLHTTPTPHTSNHTILTISTTKQKLPTVNVAKTAKIKKLSTVIHTTTSTATKQVTASGTAAIKGDHTASVNTTVLVLKSPANSDIKTIRDKSTTSVGQNVQSTPTKLASGSGPKTAKDKLTLSTNQTVSIKSPAISSVKTSVKIPSTPTKSATGSSAKDKLITSVNQTVSIKSPSVNGTNKVTVAKTALSTSSKPAIASGTVVNKVKHTTLVNQTASVKTSLLNNVKAVTEKPALAVVKTTLSTLTKVVTASDTMASTNKQEASVSKTASSSSMKPTTEKLPLTPVKTSLSTPTSTKTVTANGTVTNKDKQTASVNQTASLKTGTSNAKTTADKPVLTVVRTALSMPILAKPATASSTTTNKDKYNASTNQTALGKTNTSHVRTMTDKPVLTMSKTAHSTPTSAKPVAANGSMTNKIKQTASVNKTASIKTSTSNVKTMADKPALKVVKTVLPTSTKSPAASGAAARKDKGTVSVDQTEVIKSPASSPVKTTDKPMPPIKVLITDSCDSSQHKEQELKLKPGSPLVMTHKISLMPGGCTGGCVAEMAALIGRVERLEKEMSSVKDKCPCSVNCPNDCSGNGKCEKGKCVCLQGFLGPDCSRCSPGADCHNKTKKEKVKIDVEVVTTAVSQDSNTVQENGKKAEKTLLQKKEQKKGSEGKELDATPKVATTVKVGLIKTQAKQASSVTKTNIKGSVSTKTVQPTVGQVLLKHKGRKQEEARKGRTTFLTAKDPQPKPDIKHVTVKEGTSAKANTKSGHLQDQPHTNETLSIIKMSNDTAKVPTIRTKVAETSNNKTSVGKETLEQSTLAEKNVTQSPAIKLNKKVKTEHLNVTKVVQFVQNTKTETGGSGKDKAMQKSQYLVNVTSVESRDESKVLQNKTALQFSGNATRRAGGAGLGSVKVANITSYSFTFTWYAPQGMFKNFTVIRREYREEEEEEAHLDGETAAATAKNTTEGQTQRESINATSAKVSGSRGKAEGQRVSMVLPGSVRSIEFGHLQPQTRYSLQVFGTSPGKRSKIHRVTVTTGPEPATELVFSSVTESSLTVSWSKPKGMFAGFRVTYTNYVTGESSFEIVNSKKSHVVLSKLSAGSSYVISVTTIQGQLQSDALTSTITTVPAPLTYLQAVNVTDTRALLQWTPSPGKVDRFIITYESSKTPNVTVTVMLSGNSVEHQLRGLQRGTLYTVKALSQKGSLQSTSISTTFTTANVVKASEVGARSAVIAWKASTIAFHSYRLTYQVAGEEIQELNLEPTITEYKLTGLVAMTRYIILVQGERDGKYTSVVTTDFMTGNLRFPHPTECSQELLNGALQSGEVDIYPHGKEGAAVRVYCDMETDGGGWTVFQRRMNGKADFFRTWSEYRAGFGNLSEEFWLGNELLHNLTSVGPVSLRVDLRVGNDTAYAHYSNFTVDTEENHYTLMLSGYTGTAGDSMRYHNGRPFSTRDKDPDTLGIHCAKAYMGGWWYKNCYKTNLNGLYGTNTNNQGVVWIDWKGKDSSIPFTEMMFRPSGFSPATQG